MYVYIYIYRGRWIRRAFLLIRFLTHSIVFAEIQRAQEAGCSSSGLQGIAGSRSSKQPQWPPRGLPQGANDRRQTAGLRSKPAKHSFSWIGLPDHGCSGRDPTMWCICLPSLSSCIASEFRDVGLQVSLARTNDIALPTFLFSHPPGMLSQWPRHTLLGLLIPYGGKFVWAPSFQFLWRPAAGGGAKFPLLWDTRRCSHVASVLHLWLCTYCTAWGVDGGGHAPFVFAKVSVWRASLQQESALLAAWREFANLREKRW